MLLSHNAMCECVAARLETVGRTNRAGRIDSLHWQRAVGAREALPCGLSVSSFCLLLTGEVAQHGRVGAALIGPALGARERCGNTGTG
jgi:hypothetical protein